MPEGMTRRQHLDWCIERAIQEMDHYNDPRMAYTSMASDLGKHPETASPSLIQLCIMQPVMNPGASRQQVINFLKGFN